MNHIVSAILVAEHLNDLLREAEEGRRSNLLQGARRSPWSAFTSRLAGLRSRPVATVRRDRPTTTTSGTHPAAA